MPDVIRTDSQRSDASVKPRVSFNRDVHVKRIVPRESARVGGVVNGDGASHLVASPVRKERLKKSKKELAEEAARILQQADQIDCVTGNKGVRPERFYTLPNRKKKDYSSASLDRRIKRRGSLELVPPKKPPRTFVASSQPPQKTSIFDIFKKDKKPEPKKSNLRRSVSDASNLKSKTYGPSNNEQPYRKRSGSDAEDVLNNSRNSKKQLSPIIEVTQREDYFTRVDIEHDKENINNNENLNDSVKRNDSVTEKLKEYIDEVDEQLFKETGVKISPPKEESSEPLPIIIDVEKAEKISGKNKKFKDSALGKKLKSITHKKSKINEAGKNKKSLSKTKVKSPVKVEEKPKTEEKVPLGSLSPSPKIKAAVENFEKLNRTSPTMIHSSQKPADKLPLTKGRTVNSMVKRLSNDSCSPPPPKTSIMITPHGSVQHNNNQPFSYTRGLSPEKYMSNENLPNPGSPIIYAQVVCGSNGTGPAKQTVHAAYPNGKKHPHSDSDEGLGGEENSGFSRLDKSVTHFGDDRYNGNSFRKSRDEYLDDDKFEEESPITPKFRNPAYLNGFSDYERKINESSRLEYSGYIDSSSRGRGDGMDAKRRESLTENENGFASKTLNGHGRTDLSARRDLLESRIKTRLQDNSLRISPEYIQNTTPTNIYISETTSKYYRGGSASPVGYTEKYVSESRTDKYGQPRKVESRSKHYFGERKDSLEYENHVKSNGYQYNGFDSEPKSFDSQISDYRSSPENRHFEASHNKSNNRYNSRSENQKILKNRDMYKSTPEIHQKSYREEFHDSYHDSLRRDKVENRVTNSSKYRSERYLDQSESERKDKFGDSGIENDFRRDSGENFRVSRPSKSRREYCNESEDEGFASSLLIASERQHTEDNINHRKRRDYDSDRANSREDDSYRNMEHMDYKSKVRHDYVPRERSIDDGSHYDPRIDKDGDRSTLKRVDKKPPKPEKKSGLEKVKSLFTRDSKKKKEKQQPGMVPEESLRARYVEYKGRDTVDSKLKKKQVKDVQASNDYSNRRRLSTPSPSPTRETQRNGKSETTHGSWFKSLDRLSRKKTNKDEREGNFTSGTEEDTPTKPIPTKNLRFFGDTDIESNDSVRHRSSLKTRPGISYRDRTRSQSTRDLHNISEELRTPELNVRKNSHKSMMNISESDRDIKGSRVSLKPPISPSNRAPREVPRQREERERGRRRKNEVSSVESSTEGDSSQQSQRSIVYLHAATVGDIPGPGYIRNGRRAASREELASNGSSRIQPQVKTLSRSFSVLAPWKPRLSREGMDIDYTQYPKPSKNGKYEQRVPKNTSSRKDNTSTLKKKAQETKKNNNSTLNRRSKSKENVSSQTLRRSREELSRGSSSTLYKKKDRLPRENSRYTKDREDKKISSKSLSVESLGSNGRSMRKSRDESRDISRSVSMPRDPEKSAGWFKMSKKSKISGSTQRL
ncbi:uncharacterized protein LOC108904981 isoform X2 [Anoplophora glabripennis]|uniref:uncharacterized protein LOC108904981 isoform X2 n=1 Tax=Anoplophora glabripennis TaxID=217634 RepID=UPI000874D561|nr:uncharacterized protein LOC108904981 isoform X2 [Anoplophora glabripennis]